MGTLIHVVMFGAVLIAFIAWAVAALSAFNVVNLAPRGEKLSAYFQLGLWRFAALEARLGAAVKPHLVRYRRAFYVFFAVIVAILALSFTIPFLKTA
ncbi:hypothetical protein [Taklimakanibacter deserti]|uniref:hypothetical protein n=1 Tax=Taklimakanibacter deserti TaxID=2267839 RepID=UPI000E64A93B